MPPADPAEDQVPVRDEEVRHRHHEQGGCGQVRAEVLEQILERRDHEDHDHRGNDECNHDHRGRIEQRGLDLALDGEDFFLIGGKTVQQGVQNTGCLSRSHQVTEQLVEIQRVFAESLIERAAGLDFGLDVQQQLGHRRIAVALADDVEGLQQRHAGLHHGGELASEQSDVFFGDLAAQARSAVS